MEGSHNLAFGAFRLDLRARRLTRGGAEVPLGARALDVLCVLAAAGGEVVSKRDLMARVWPGIAVEENNLQVQVHALRRALGEDGDNRGFVRTVSGRGYRLAADAAEPALAPPPPQTVGYQRTADGVHLAVASAGEGPPLVRAPVWMSHVEHDWRTSIWSRFLGALAARHSLVRYDPRGMGLSDREAELSFEASVSDLETVVDALGAGPVSILGISQGVAVAIAFAARRPERVSRLVLVGGYARGAIAVDPGRAASTEALATLIAERWGSDNPAFRQLFTSLGFPGATADQMQELNELQRVSATAETAARLLRIVTRVDVSRDLPKVRAPTLVMHSRDDAWIPAERSREIARGVPGARLHEIAGPNHVVLPQEPQFESYAGRMLDFLAG